MTRHARHFTLDLLAAVCFVSSVSISALAADGPPPNFAPHANAGWFAFSRTFIAPASGPGPVRPHPDYPHVSNDEYRLTGRQPTIAMGDPRSPILQPWASEVVRKRNEYILAGNPPLSRHASCWPMGIPAFLLMPMTRPMYIIQGPTQVAMILTSFNEVRRIHLADKHSDNVKTSWHGESIGRYEGDTLVVDTIGLDDRSSVDGFGTPHTKQLHVIERFRVADDGKVLEAKLDLGRRQTGHF